MFIVLDDTYLGGSDPGPVPLLREFERLSKNRINPCHTRGRPSCATYQYVAADRVDQHEIVFR
ncbi:hypothetical protein [Goodfellowiella coeruleoviolacea]|uniref:hypothetical protein n=1 Tax=Goodfellowiella coeruleoviolacea TaxID=334858 RepID=UPI0020A37C9F|nr:hypothetical protein [Goodfellowiella coeruleoviolacea]